MNKTLLIKDVQERLKQARTYYGDINAQCGLAKEHVLRMHTQLVHAVQESLARSLAEITDLEKDSFAEADRQITALHEVLLR